LDSDLLNFIDLVGPTNHLPLQESHLRLLLPSV
jgi:hypothetical protein